MPILSANSEKGGEIPPLFHSALNVRTLVFVNEQHCSAAEEVDADDAVSWHWVIFCVSPSTGEDDIPAATIRLVPAQPNPDIENQKADGPDYVGSEIWNHKEPYVKIGRVSTVKEFRGRGYGKVLVEAALEWAGKNPGSMVLEARQGLEEDKGTLRGLPEWKGLVLAHAQVSVEEWYSKLGFERDGGMGMWVEEGIEHVGMWKRVRLIS